MEKKKTYFTNCFICEGKGIVFDKDGCLHQCSACKGEGIVQVEPKDIKKD